MTLIHNDKGLSEWSTIFLNHYFIDELTFTLSGLKSATAGLESYPWAMHTFRRLIRSHC